MATFNGENFLSEQVNSILSQLSENDEIVIVDDCSKDKTIEILDSFHDKRLSVYRNSVNKGVIFSFQDAIERATGEYIFLCDQDDIWLPNKVEIMLSAFKNNDSDLVISDAYIMSDNVLELDSFFQYRRSGAGVLRNIVKNSFIGCCMAFKAGIKDIILPFPKSISMHDSWIGTLLSFYGKVIFIPERLIIYRRHEKNVTSMNRSNPASILRKRANNISSLLLRIWKIKNG